MEETSTLSAVIVHEQLSPTPSVIRGGPQSCAWAPNPKNRSDIVAENLPMIARKERSRIPGKSEHLVGNMARMYSRSGLGNQERSLMSATTGAPYELSHHVPLITIRLLVTEVIRMNDYKRIELAVPSDVQRGGGRTSEETSARQRGAVVPTIRHILI